MKIVGISHVAFAPKDPEKARWFFTEVLGLGDGGSEDVTTQKTKTDFFDFKTLDSKPRVEMITPLLSAESGVPEGPVASFLDKKGSGWHHLALCVESVDAAIVSMKAHGVELISETPQRGAHNTRVVFIHPRSTGGILVELTEEVSATV